MLEKLLSTDGKVLLEALTKAAQANKYNQNAEKLYSLATRHGPLKDRILLRTLYKKAQKQAERRRGEELESHNRTAALHLAAQVLMGETGNPDTTTTTPHLHAQQYNQLMGLSGINQQNLMNQQRQNQLGQQTYADIYKGVL